jgi:hypothetical protein
MKTFSLLLLTIAFSSCNPNANQKTENTTESKTETQEQIEYPGDKYLGYWKSDDKSEEVLRIFEYRTGTGVYKVGNGEKEFYIDYDPNSGTMKMHNAGTDIEIIYSDSKNQVSWVETPFGQTTGTVLRVYNFVKR